MSNLITACIILSSSRGRQSSVDKFWRFSFNRKWLNWLLNNFARILIEFYLDLSQAIEWLASTDPKASWKRRRRQQWKSMSGDLGQTDNNSWAAILMQLSRSSWLSASILCSRSALIFRAVEIPRLWFFSALAALELGQFGKRKIGHKTRSRN